MTDEGATPTVAEATEERDRLVGWLTQFEEQAKMVAGVRERVAYLNGFLTHAPRSTRRTKK